jgi:N-acetylglucosaminyldiphosphoundecaprenol N-acetyl-beta-D-mannosaminyltransferase
MNARCTVLTMDVDVTDLTKAVTRIENLVSLDQGAYVCVSNVHMCMETFDSEEFRDLVRSADLVVPDGRPVFWAQRLLGAGAAKQVRGQDIMNSLCEKSAARGLKIGLYGGSSDQVLNQVKQQLKETFPGIKIAYSYSPPFRLLTDAEDEQVVNDINAAAVDILFVGIGCPKQERWMAEHLASLQCVMLGVGAAYDFISGSKKHAPRWMQTVGMEWVFRLLSEPTRLWQRYLKQNPRFIYHFVWQWLLGKTHSPKKLESGD